MFVKIKMEPDRKFYLCKDYYTKTFIEYKDLIKLYGDFRTYKTTFKRDIMYFIITDVGGGDLFSVVANLFKNGIDETDKRKKCGRNKKNKL